MQHATATASPSTAAGPVVSTKLHTSAAAALTPHITYYILAALTMRHAVTSPAIRRPSAVATSDP